MGPPARLTVPTCIGCGAMAIFGSCATTCREERLDLVPAAAYEALTQVRERHRRDDAGYEQVVRQLVQTEPSELAYRDLQARALRVLSAAREPEPLEAAEVTVTWWCPDCGGLDAPQPCLGVCIWRRAEWVNAAVYAAEREQALAELERAARLRQVVRRIAHTTPRPGQLARHWRALEARARTELD